MELGSLAGTALIGVLMSAEFRSLVTEHFGESLVGSLIMLIVIGGVKHLRNMKVLGKLKADSLSGDSDFDPNSVVLL